MGWLLLQIACTVLVGCATALAFIYMFQRRLIYFPSTEAVVVQPAAAAAGLRNVDLTASDGVLLKAWHWPGQNRLTFLLFHGNAGHRGHRFHWMEALRETGAGIFALDYRGYGGSGGSPSEEGLYRDAEAAAQWLQSNGNPPVVYIGESLGSAVAVELALRRPPAALILQSTFTSLTDVGRQAYPFLPVAWLLKDRFDSLSKIGRLSCPVLCIHGEKDSIVPVAIGRALYERIPGRKEWYVIPGGDHNDPFWDLEPGYVGRIGRFVGM